MRDDLRNGTARVKSDLAADSQDPKGGEAGAHDLNFGFV